MTLIISIIALILLIAVVEFDDEALIFWPSAILCIYGAVLWFFFREIAYPVLQWINESPLRLTIYFIFYIGLGICWSTFKWFRLVYKQKNKFNEWLVDKKRFLTQNHLNEQIKKNFKEDVKCNLDNFKPNANKHKSDISGWLIFWPFSILRYLVGTAILDFFKFITNSLAKFYSSITDRVFSTNEKDIEL
jgi:hypothetical protein